MHLRELVWSYYDGPREKSRCLDGRGGSVNRGLFIKWNGQNYTTHLLCGTREDSRITSGFLPRQRGDGGTTQEVKTESRENRGGPRPSPRSLVLIIVIVVL